MMEPGNGNDGFRRMICGGPVSAALAMALLLTGPGVNEAVAGEETPPSPGVTLARVDTATVAGRRLFEGRLVFSPEYLTRAIAAARTTTNPTEVAIEQPSEEALAAVYAARYRISEDLALQIIESAIREGLDPELGFRLVRVESVFRVNARGSSGSLGLTQLMPSTARAIDRSLRTESQILDPSTNLRTGFRYLRRLIQLYDGDVRLGLLAYNRGQTAVDRALRAGQDPENGYSPKVLSLSGSHYTGDGLLPTTSRNP